MHFSVLLAEAEAEVAKRLEELATDGGFIIVSAGDYYVQYRSQDEVPTLRSEAVSNAFLPAERQLDVAQTKELEGRGFTLCLDSKNFFRECSVHGPDDARKEARLTLEILQHVYGCSAACILRIESEDESVLASPWFWFIIILVLIATIVASLVYR